MDTSTHPIIILGSGLAGYSLLREIRKRDQDLPVTIITADSGHAYSKPNLSNALSQGRTAHDLGSQTAIQVGASLKATILPHTQVDRIDPVERRIHTVAGSLSYEKLGLAMGADPIGHGVQGNAAENIISVNNLEDYHRFRAAIAGKKRITILGGGLIGCEFANDLAHAGYEVRVVHLGPWPLERLLPESCGLALYQGLERLGVLWHFGRKAMHAEVNGDAMALSLDDGTIIEADVILSAIGLQSRRSLATDAGIEVNRGIIVNRYLATSKSHIYAIGDCAEVAGMVLPFVQPLLQQARSLAATLTGTPTAVSYPAMPVVVKTSAMPVVVAPPDRDAQGCWQISRSNDGVDARFINSNNKLLGFALVGQATALRSSLTKELPVALLPIST